MKKVFFLSTILMLLASVSHAQFSLSGGPSILKPFGVRSTYAGFHISAEFNDDDINTIYGRFSFFPANNGSSFPITVQAKDFNTSPSAIQVNVTEKYNYSFLEFGKRYYLGDGYESGFGAYGGSSLGIVLNKLRYSLDEYDKTLYDAPVDDNDIGSIIGMTLGLNAGLKNSFYFGTMYLDAGVNYSLFRVLSPNMSGLPGSYTNLFFAVNIGFRKDFY